MCLSQHVGGRKLWGLQFRQLKILLIVKGKEALCKLAYNVFLRVWKAVSVVLQLEILYWWKTFKKKKKKNILAIQEFIVSVPGHEYKWVLGLGCFAYVVWTYVYNGEVFCVDIDRPACLLHWVLFWACWLFGILTPGITGKLLFKPERRFWFSTQCSFLFFTPLPNACGSDPVWSGISLWFCVVSTLTSAIEQFI